MKPSNKPTVITYLRYSSAMQKDGLSEYRQADIIKRNVIDFCEEKDVSLDDIIALSDRGVSGYRGKNLTEGSLSQIISKFQSGELPKNYDENGEINTYLFIESIDRLTRLPLPKATTVFLSIVEHCNIVVVSDNERKVYTYKNLQDQSGMFDLLQALMVISRSHNESAMKEMRHRANWSAKRAKAAEYFDLPDALKKEREYPKNVTSSCPWFMRPKPDGKGFEFIEENKEVMMFFINKLKDGYGYVSILKQIHTNIENGILKPKFTERQRKANGYSFSAFHTFFKEDNEILIGNLSFCECYYVKEEDVANGKYDASKLGKQVRIPAEKLIGYYPALIGADDFNLLKSKVRARVRQKYTVNKKIKNIAQGISKCAICGSSLVYKPDNNGVRKGKLTCYRSKRGLCKGYIFNYTYFENNILKYCRSINISKVMGVGDAQNEKDRESALKTDIEKKRFNITSIEKELKQIISNLMIITAENVILSMQDQYVKKELEIKKIKNELTDLESELQDIYYSINNSAKINNKISELIDLISEDGGVIYRERLNIELRSAIKSLLIYHESHPENVLNRKLVAITFRDGYTRLIPIDKFLEDSDMYAIPPILDFKELQEIPDQLILPFDYFDGKEEGRYPEVAFMPKFYQENPALYNQIRSEIEAADKLMKVVN